MGCVEEFVEAGFVNVSEGWWCRQRELDEAEDGGLVRVYKTETAIIMAHTPEDRMREALREIRPLLYRSGLVDLPTWLREMEVVFDKVKDLL